MQMDPEDLPIDDDADSENLAAQEGNKFGGNHSRRRLPVDMVDMIRMYHLAGYSYEAIRKEIKRETGRAPSIGAIRGYVRKMPPHLLTPMLPEKMPEIERIPMALLLSAYRQATVDIGQLIGVFKLNGKEWVQGRALAKIPPVVREIVESVILTERADGSMQVRLQLTPRVKREAALRDALNWYHGNREREEKKPDALMDGTMPDMPSHHMGVDDG